MATFQLKPERSTLHGTFSRDYEPVLTIDSGDTVIYETLDPGWFTRMPGDRDSSPRFEPRDPERDGGHALCGPVEIRGARAGMVLEIAIGAILPGTWGWTCAGGWKNGINEYLGLDAGERFEVRWQLDAETMTGTSDQGHRLPLQPFMGVMGMPPAAPGVHSTGPPRPCGGNLDCKELTTGSTLFLPIEVDGALFSVGDGHARQGDGEACQIAIECPMRHVELKFALRDDLQLATPRIETAAAWITLGLHEDLDQAATLALDAMLDVLVEHYQIERKYAFALASLSVDLRITQMVNGTRGVHAVLARDLIEAVDRSVLDP